MLSTLTKILKYRNEQGSRPISHFHFTCNTSDDQKDLDDFADVAGQSVISLSIDCYGESAFYLERIFAVDWSRFTDLKHLSLSSWAGLAAEHAVGDPRFRSYDSSPFYPFTTQNHTTESTPSVNFDSFSLRIQIPGDNECDVTSIAFPGEVLPSQQDLANAMLRVRGPRCRYDVQIKLSERDDPDEWTVMTDYFKISMRKAFASIVAKAHGINFALEQSGPACTHKNGRH